MELLASHIVEAFYALLWPFVRISALLLVSPIFSLQAVNVRVRVFFALILTLTVYPLLDWPRIDPLSAAGLYELVNQVLIGAMMGLILQFVTGTILVAGQAMSNSIGLAMANMIDPNLGNVSVLAQFLVVVSTLVFLGLGGHILVVMILLASFETLPIGTDMIQVDAFGSVLAWSGIMFAGALMIALPVMAVLLLIQVGLGVVTRAAPSLNIFAVGFPAMLLVGFAILITSMSSTVFRIEWLWWQAFSRVRELVGLSGVI